MNRNLVLILVLALTLPAIGGCAAVVVGGVAAGALVAHDRRTPGAVLEDQQIEFSALSVLHNHPEIKEHSHISVTSYNMRALLTGEAETPEIARQFANLVSELPHVRSVYNEVSVDARADLWDETEDTYLTSKIKVALVNVDVEGFDPTMVKVVTSRGDVFLMGLVTRTEGQAVIDEVRVVAGVQRVVEVFEYIDD